MRKLFNYLRDLFFGYSCPECGVRPDEFHESTCSIGKWDGGIWA